MLEQFDRHVRKESGEEGQRISLGKSPCMWEQGHTRTYSVLWEYSERILLGDKMEEINQGQMWMLTIESQNNLNCHLRPMDDQNYSRKKWVFTWRFFFYLSIYLLIYGCAESSLLCGIFSSCGKLRLPSSCRIWPSHCTGFSCCGAWALGHTGFSSCDLRSQ